MATKKGLKIGHGGDVQFMETKLPASAVKIENKPVAYGEHSGHIHVVTGDVDMYEDNGTMYAVVGKKGGWLQHVHQSVFQNRYGMTSPIEKADHKPIELENGKTYVFGIHKRYNPFAKVWENAKD